MDIIKEEDDEEFLEENSEEIKEEILKSIELKNDPDEEIIKEKKSSQVITDVEDEDNKEDYIMNLVLLLNKKRI